MFAALGPVGGSIVFWVIFLVLLAAAWLGSPPPWLKLFLAFAMSVVLTAAVVTTLTASGVKIHDLIAVLDQLGIKSP
ncbi:MAG: hypothetical protein ACREMY_01630 [bacterium]